MILVIANALALLASAAGSSEPPPDMVPASAAEIEAVCKTILCRPPKPIRLKLEDGKMFEMKAPTSMPIVGGSGFTVLPGEQVFVEAEAKDGRLINLVAVPKVAHPEKTLVFSFRQDPTLGSGTDMVLEATSPFPGALKYRLGMMLPSEGRFLKTSSCPLHQGRTAFEHWPHPIFQIIAGGFRLVDESSEAASKCE